jgi:hypothetical protein
MCLAPNGYSPAPRTKGPRSSSHTTRSQLAECAQALQFGAARCVRWADRHGFKLTRVREYEVRCVPLPSPPPSPHPPAPTRISSKLVRLREARGVARPAFRTPMGCVRCWDTPGRLHATRTSQSDSPSQPTADLPLSIRRLPSNSRALQLAAVLTATTRRKATCDLRRRHAVPSADVARG